MTDEIFTSMGIHRALVHFPIALLVAGVAFELLGRVFRKPNLGAAGYYTLLAGVLSGIPVLATGLIAKGDLEGNTVMSPVVARHQALAIATVALFTGALLWRSITAKKSAGIFVAIYLLILSVGGATTLATGYFGGEIGHGHVHEHGEEGAVPSEESGSMNHHSPAGIQPPHDTQVDTHEEERADDHHGHEDHSHGH